MLHWYCSYNGAIIISCRCVKLLIPGYISVQVEDSKVEQMNYVMRKVNLKLYLQNEQKYMKWAKIVKISISFNRLVFPSILTDSQLLDNSHKYLLETASPSSLRTFSPMIHRSKFSKICSEKSIILFQIAVSLKMFNTFWRNPGFIQSHIF